MRDELYTQTLNALSLLTNKKAKSIIELHKKIHACPELALEEVKTSKALADTLERNGFDVSRKTADIDTAFVAIYDSGRKGPTVTYTAEMDALPEIGHACGHSMVGVASVYAAVVLKEQLADKLTGKLVVVGTPAEERYSAKADLIDAGVFNDSDVVLQMHGENFDANFSRALALREIEVEYFGKTSHAAAAPDKGINALDAIVSFYNMTSLARQHFPKGAMFHGIITNGGVAPNIIPEYASGRFYMRAEKEKDMKKLYKKIIDCVKSAANATGAKYNVNESKYTATIKPNNALEKASLPAYEYLGRKVGKIVDKPFSTDVGNVSQVVPTVQLRIRTSLHPLHTVGFRDDVVSEQGERALLDSVVALAFLGVRVFTEPELLKEVKADFKRS